jgi:hypothetical protein
MQSTSDVAIIPPSTIVPNDWLVLSHHVVAMDFRRFAKALETAKHGRARDFQLFAAMHDGFIERLSIVSIAWPS